MDRHPPCSVHIGSYSPSTTLCRPVGVPVPRALCAGPDVLLADEPTGNLDPAAAAEVLRLFDRLHENGRTIVLITHDREAAARAERTIRIENGRIVR